MIKTLPFLLLGALLCCMMSCGDPIAKEKNLDTVRFHYLAETEFFQIQQMFTNIYQSQDTSETLNPFCVGSQIFQYESSDSLFTEIDFGDGCNCQDGRLRQGKLISSSPLAAGSEEIQLQLFADHYSFTHTDGNLYQVDFIYQISFGEPESPLSITSKISRAVFSNLNGTFFWKGNFLSKPAQLTDDPELGFQGWHLSGTASLKDEMGHESHANTISPLIYRDGCSQPVSGIVSMSSPQQQGRIIDFGQGECDHLARVQIGVFSASLPLP